MPFLLCLYWSSHITCDTKSNQQILRRICILILSTRDSSYTMAQTKTTTEARIQKRNIQTHTSTRTVTVSPFCITTTRCSHTFSGGFENSNLIWFCFASNSAEQIWKASLVLVLHGSIVSQSDNHRVYDPQCSVWARDLFGTYIINHSNRNKDVAFLILRRRFFFGGCKRTQTPSYSRYRDGTAANERQTSAHLKLMHEKVCE